MILKKKNCFKLKNKNKKGESKLKLVELFD